MEKKFGMFSSSVNPQEFSKSWEAGLKIIGTIAGVLVTLPTVNQFISQIEIQTVINSLTVAGGAIVAIYQSGELIFGIVRKVIQKF